MVIFGSGSIISALAPLNLIDEYRLFVNPVILSRGNPEFRNIQSRIRKLLKIRAFKSGMVELYYQPESAQFGGERSASRCPARTG